MDEPPITGMTPDPATAKTRPVVSRRAALGALGIGLVGGGALGAGVASRRGSSSSYSKVLEQHSLPQPLTVAAWIQARGERYFIAHRGSGDVYPEHSFPAYDAALQWGAQAMEVSVWMTSDRVLVCIHDSTYDRTTTARGSVKSQPYSVVRDASLRAPQLGPAWQGPTAATLLRIPRFEDVLLRYGGRMILCLDAKDDAAFAAMMTLVDRLGLHESVVAKVYASSPNLRVAQDAGLPVFGYYGTAVTDQKIDRLAAKLNPRQDYLVITPATIRATDADVAAVAHAVGTGVTTWAGALHSRYEVDRYFAAGARGMVCSSYGYQSSTTAVTARDAWASRAITSGEMTVSPTSAVYAPAWTGDADLTLALPNAQHYLTLGNLSPVAAAAGSYQIDFDARWNVLPADATTYAGLTFAHTDDRYWESFSGVGSGYEAVLRANGSLELSAHTDGTPTPSALGQASTPAPAAGTWIHLRVAVTPKGISVSRTDSDLSAVVSANATAQRGGYLHIGRSSADAVSSLSLRNLVIS